MKINRNVYLYSLPRIGDCFAFIRYDGSRLSISGVEGPSSQTRGVSAGDCFGSCGQCNNDGIVPDDAENIAPHAERLLAEWKRWHLNDMRPECEHQRALGWREKASEPATLYHWRLSPEASAEQKRIEKAVLAAVKLGGIGRMTKAERRLSSLPYGAVTWTPDPPAPEYQAKTPLYPGDGGSTESKALGWLLPEEHPEGLLCRPCPECGYRYGSEWRREDVPAEVLAFLDSIPDSSFSIPKTWLQD